MGAGLAIFKKDMGNTEYFKRKVEWERLREYCRVGVGQWLEKISRYLALIWMGEGPSDICLQVLCFKVL